MKRKLETVISISLLTFGAIIFLTIGCLTLKRGEQAEATFLIVISIIMAIWSHELGVRKALDERFGNLEKLLREQQKNKKEEKAGKKDVDKSVDG